MAWSSSADRRALRRRREVQAAGGVVLRPAGGFDGTDRVDPGFEVLLVHRPRYDDWSLPKGKAHGRETPAETARREVLEETGYSCAVGPEVAVVRYVDQRGRPKVVRYFAMRVERGSFVANDEVDEVAWCSSDDAERRLSYAPDHGVVVAALALAW